MSLWWACESDVTVSAPPQHRVTLQDVPSFDKAGLSPPPATHDSLKAGSWKRTLAPPSHHDCSKERRLAEGRGTGVSWDWLLKKRCLASHAHSRAAGTHRSSPWLILYTSSYFSSTVTRYIQVCCFAIRLACFFVWYERFELFCSFDIVTLLPDQVQFPLICPCSEG